MTIARDRRLPVGELAHLDGCSTLIVWITLASIAPLFLTACGLEFQVLHRPAVAKDVAKGTSCF